MYVYEKKIVFDVPEVFECWDFGLQLQKSDFKFMNSYYSFRRGNLGHEDEVLTVRQYVPSNNEQEVAKKVELELQVLSYISLVPLLSLSQRTRFYHIDIEVEPQIECFGSRRKMERVEELGAIILRQRKSKELFLNIMRTFYAGLQHYYMEEEFWEDSFLGFFRVVESVSVWAYDKEEKSKNLPIIKNKNRIYSKIEESVADIFEKDIEITYNPDIYKDIKERIYNIIESSVDALYPKINRFCVRKRIQIESETIHELVLIRNKIAHGNVYSIRQLRDNMFPILKLARDIIAKQFFDREFDDFPNIGYIG